MNNRHRSRTVGTVKGYQYIEVSTHVYKRKVLYVSTRPHRGNLARDLMSLPGSIPAGNDVTRALWLEEIMEEESN